MKTIFCNQLLKMIMSKQITCPCPLSTALCKIREHRQNLDLCTVQPNQDGTEPPGWWDGKQKIWDPVALHLRWSCP